MGNFNSGRRGGRPLVEAVRSIDVNRLAREGCLDGWRGGGGWKDADGNWAIQFELTIKADEIHMSEDQDGATLKQVILLTSTPCHFGGARRWFQCPYCRHRRGKLYRGGNGWACRTCYGLIHTSTREEKITRLHRKMGRLEARLAEDGSKPKGMHERTYEAILDQMDNVEAGILTAFVAGARRILGWA
jgi:Zn-finger protein